MQITFEQAIARIAEELCVRELNYRQASLANGQPVLANPEDFFAFDVRDGDMGEMIMESFVAKLHEFETRPQARDYLVSKGMSELFAFAAIDQQYNYDEPGDENQPLRQGPADDDFPNPVTQSFADLDQVYDTWLPMLSIEDGVVCVDHEPTYDLHGNFVFGDE